LAVNICSALVKIGSAGGNVNFAAVLELSNNTNAAHNNWKSFIPPNVNFNNGAFTSNSSWGIAGTPSVGAVVYNTGESYSNGFSGPGLYCWHRNSWAPFSILVTDKIRLSLSTGITAYDAAIVNSWVNVTAAEYNNLLTVINGAARYATPEIYMNTAANAGWSPNFTVGGSENAAKVPASSYIIGWSIRTGTGVSTSSNSTLKFSSSQTAGYVDYGNPLPNVSNILTNTRIYFILKTPIPLSPQRPAKQRYTMPLPIS